MNKHNKTNAKPNCVLILANCSKQKVFVANIPKVYINAFSIVYVVVIVLDGNATN